MGGASTRPTSSTAQSSWQSVSCDDVCGECQLFMALLLVGLSHSCHGCPSEGTLAGRAQSRHAPHSSVCLGLSAGQCTGVTELVFVE